MADTRGCSIPGFWQICSADAYLFKFCCIFLPLLLLMILYNILAANPLEVNTLPAAFLAVVLGVVYFRWSALRSIFTNHVVFSCRIAGVSKGIGLFGIQIYVSFTASFNGEEEERGCFLVKFNRRVKRLQQGDRIEVFWNEHTNRYLIKEAYLD